MRILLTLLFLVLYTPLGAMAAGTESYQVPLVVDCVSAVASCSPLEGEEPAEATGDPFAGQVDPLATDGLLALDNAGVLDGIYVCEMTYGSDGRSPLKSQIYVSVNGKRNGDAVFIIGEVEARPDAYFGWGMGRVAEETDGDTFLFAGQTSEGQPFSLKATFGPDDSVLAVGEAIVLFGGASGQKVEVKTRLSCQSIW